MNTPRERPHVEPGKVWVGKEGTFLLRKSSQAWGRVAEGGGGVPTHGGVQGEVGRGAWGHGAVGDGGWGGWTR